MDYSILLKQISTAYNQLEAEGQKPTLSKGEVIDIFLLFYQTYFEYMGTQHPHLKTETIKNCIESISSDDCFEYDIDAYRGMIPKYFETDFPKCNYSIVHFLSGSIRQFRFYEVCY